MEQSRLWQKVRNIGSREGTAVVQLYIQDVVGSQARPVKELKGFRRVTLAPGEEKEICFAVDEPMLRFTMEKAISGVKPENFVLLSGSRAG